jgi:hypothetical protein
VAQPLLVVGRELVPDLVGELEDGLRTKATVQVVVEQDLGRSVDLLAGRFGHGPSFSSHSLPEQEHGCASWMTSTPWLT